MKVKAYIRSFTSFVTFNAKVVKKLFNMDKFKTMVLFTISILLPLAEIIELKFLEYLTNVVAYYDISNNTAFQSILLTVSGFIGVLLFLYLSSWIFDLVNNWYSKDISEKVNSKFLKKISKIPYEYFECSEFYDKIWVSKSAANQYSMAILHIVFLLNFMIYFISYSVMLCKINIVFILFVIAAFLVNIFVSSKAMKKWDEYYDKYVVPEERKCSYFEGILANRINHHMVQVNRQLPYFIEKYEKHADNERKGRLKMTLLSFSVKYASSLVFLVIFAFSLIYTAKKVVAGVYDIGKFTLVTSALFKMFDILKNLTNYIFTQKGYIKVLRTYNEIIELEDEDLSRFKKNSNELVLKNVTYKYKQAEQYAIKNLNFKFRSGEKIAVVGENGSGKTTFISIILGLLKQNLGEYVNNIGEMTAIMQDFKRDQFTGKENIELGLGGKSMSDSEVIDILKKVQLYEAVMKYPEGINTNIGQLSKQGIEFSKGQMQRLAMARLLANKDAKIWILDEPTAYLDPIAEIDMYQYILSLAENRLVFFISHRLGFARKADKIIVIDNGRITESGTHDELISSVDSKYYNMYQLQKEWFLNSGELKVED